MTSHNLWEGKAMIRWKCCKDKESAQGTTPSITVPNLYMWLKHPWAMAMITVFLWN